MKRTATSVNPDNLPVVEELAPHEIVERQVMRIISYAIFCAGRDCVSAVFNVVITVIQFVIIFPMLGLFFSRSSLKRIGVDEENAKMMAGFYEGLFCEVIAVFILSTLTPLKSNVSFSEFIALCIPVIVLTVLAVFGVFSISMNYYGGYQGHTQIGPGEWISVWKQVERGPMVFRYLFSPLTSFLHKRYELAENELIQKLIEERKKGASGEMVR